MKCPVCLTEISQDTCPNCGWNSVKIPQENKRIKVKDIFFEKDNKKKTSSKKGIIEIILSIIGLFVVIIRLLFGSSGDGGLLSMIESYKYNRMYQDTTFEEILLNDYDEDNTVENILEYKNNILEYLNMNNYVVTDEYEYCTKENNSQPLEANIRLDFIKEETSYGLNITYQYGEIIGGRFQIDYLEENSDRTKFHAPKDEIDMLGQFINFDNAYQLLADSHPFMENTVDYENIYEYYSYDPYTIRMSESIDGNDCSYYYSIDY